MNFIDYPPKHSHVPGDSPYAQYVNACVSFRSMWVSGSKVSTAHECNHGTASQLRNRGVAADIFSNKNKGNCAPLGRLFEDKMVSLGIKTGKINGFYLGKNRAIILQEPHVDKSKVAQFIPKSLREYRFSTYVIGQRAWSECLYLFDEWTAYQAGADVAIWMAQSGDNSEKNHDWILGVVEFIVYSLGVLIATEQYDPQGLTRDPLLLEFSRWNLIRSFNQYYVGREYYPWDSQDRIIENLKNHKDGGRLRDFMEKHLNLKVPDGVVDENEEELGKDLFDTYGN